MLKRLVDGKTARWDVEITGANGGLLFRAVGENVTIYKDFDMDAYHVFSEGINDDRKLQGIFAGNLVVSIRPKN